VTRYLIIINKKSLHPVFPPPPTPTPQQRGLRCKSQKKEEGERGEGNKRFDNGKRAINEN
jgi:hypothetical protein